MKSIGQSSSDSIIKDYTKIGFPGPAAVQNGIECEGRIIDSYRGSSTQTYKEIQMCTEIF